MKAIDIAVLMPRDIEQQIQSINASQPKNERQYTYTDVWPYPHISLYMWAMNDSEIHDMKTKIEVSWILKSSLDIKTTDLQVYKNKKGEVRYFFEVTKSEELVSMQDCIIWLWSDYLWRGIRNDMYMDSDKVSESSMYYCENYKTLAAWEKFYPHISLGMWKPLIPTNSFTFKTNRLVIGQMGPSWTMRKILFEFTLWS